MSCIINFAFITRVALFHSTRCIYLCAYKFLQQTLVIIEIKEIFAVVRSWARIPLEPQNFFWALFITA